MATDEKCPCGSGRSYAECCEPIIKGTEAAATPEALMRSRFSAYVKAEVDHVIKSTSPKQREGLDENATRAWALGAKWHGLQILKTEKGGAEDDEGTVEFIASYNEGPNFKAHHELGRFRKLRGKWYYEDGDMVKPAPITREEPRVGRNDVCPCGSGKKYKKCHGAASAQAQ